MARLSRSLVRQVRLLPLGVPIFVRGVVYGDLYLAEKEDGEFTEADEEIVTLHVASAVRFWWW